ncbi:MAG: immunity 26/phosphotriesterase HocA family protein [Clostridiaceae bacterium]
MQFTNELIKMNPSRKRPKEGDIFVIQPKENVYFYGKIIRTNLPSTNGAVRGWNLIYIYRQSAKQITLPDFLNPKQLLIPPQIVNNQGWLKGYFQTIGNVPVTLKDIAQDYGFLDYITKKYVDEEGRFLSHKPLTFTNYGLGSYGVIGILVQKALVANPELADIN